MVIGDVHLALFALKSLYTLLEIKRIVFYERYRLKSQVFFKKIWPIDMLSLYSVVTQ